VVCVLAGVGMAVVVVVVVSCETVVAASGSVMVTGAIFGILSRIFGEA
jgi:hypothetical protein